MKTWKTLSRTPIFSFGKYLTLEQHSVELPDGRVIPDWPWIITPDFVNVVAIDEQGRFLVFRQVKYAVKGESLAPVGGYIEPGEDPLAAARRELLEETGYEALDWQYLGSYAVDANRGAGTAHFFIASGARPVSSPITDDLEEQQLLLMSRAELQTALTQGEFKTLPWMAVIALALLH